MPPIWFCLDCERVAYGWAPGGDCIYCGGPNVVGTDEATYKREPPTNSRLLFIPPRQWSELKGKALRANKSISDLLAEQEGAAVDRIRDEPVQHGKLVLLRVDRKSVGNSSQPVEGLEQHPVEYEAGRSD